MLKIYTKHESVQGGMRTQLHTCSRKSRLGQRIENNAVFKCKSDTSELSIHEDFRNSVTDVVMIYVDMNVHGAQERSLRTTSR